MTHKEISFSDFSKANRARCEDPDGFNHPIGSWSFSDWFLAFIGEAGEAANVAKKLNRYRDGIRGNKETADALHAKLRQELGDAFVYLDLMAQSVGIDIFDAGIEVFDRKSDDIGYPVKLRATPVSDTAPAGQGGGA